MPVTHIIPLERRTLHGHFSPDLPPILTIQPGDTVITNTLDAGWGVEKPTEETVWQRKRFEPRDPIKDAGHCLIGPVYVEGAKPGQTLAVHVKALRPGAWGWSAAGGTPIWVNQHFGWTQREDRVWHIWTLDADANVGRNQHGHTIALRPFLGLIGMPPPESGIHDTSPPRAWGGNLDCKELVVGSTLYLPVPVDGGLLSFGDGHATQGDGEVSGVAVECPMERVELSIDLLDDFPVTAPVANTPSGWLTLAVNENLNTATLDALDAMVDLIARLHSMDRKHALALASVTVDMRITQIANGVNGVHALLPHGAIR